MRMRRALIAAGAAVTLAAAGFGSTLLVSGGVESAEASGETEAVALIDEGVAHLKLTSITYPQWLKRNYPPGVRETTRWWLAFDALERAKAALVTEPPPTTTTEPPTTSEPPPATTEPPPATTEPPPTTTAPPPSTDTANLWVDTSGGSCTRSSVPVAYDDTKACGSFNAAYDAANATADGSTVLIRGGNYGAQAFTGARSSSNRVVLDEAAGEQVVVAGLTFGLTFGNVYDAIVASGPDHITVRGISLGISGGGPNRIGIRTIAGTSNVTLDGVQAGSADFWTGNNVSAENGAAHNIIVRNSRFGPCWQTGGGGGCSNNKVERALNFTLENNEYFDYLNGEHYECIFLNGGANITLRGNVFRNCSGSAGVFTEDTTRVGYQNMLIENNVFGPAQGAGGTYSQYALAVGCKLGHVGYTTLTIRNNSFARNARLDLGSFAGCNTASDITMTGNILPFQGSCPARVVWSYNVFNSGINRTGTCGTGDVSVGGTTFPFYTTDTLAPDGNSYKLAGPLAAPDNRVPSELCAPSDFTGAARGGSFCDAGAYER
jgi:hypothetical protein